MNLLRSLSLLALAAASVAASADLIDFTGDSQGGKPNGFTSVGSPNVSFSDTLGANLSVQDFGNQTIGRGLIVRGDDVSALRMDFTGRYTSLSLAFGNDDPDFTTAGDLAILDLYLGSALIDSVSVVMNRDDVMNQTIAYSGSAFDGAVFRYANAAGANLNLVEVVDNVEFGGRISSVPGPLAALPFALMALRRRKRA